MREVEVKILEVNVPSVVSKLKKLGAKKVFEGEMKSTLYDFSDRRLKKKGALLRVRMKGDTHELTFKQKSSHARVKIYEEHEIQFSSIEKMDKILKGMGLVPQKKKDVAYSKKHRVSYALKDAHFELDTFSGIPTFLEIETNSPKKIEFYVKKLGFSMKQAKPWNGKQVLEYYQKGRGKKQLP